MYIKKSGFSFFLISGLFLSISLNVCSQNVKLGIEVLAEKDFEPLSGKKVGLITNATGVDRHLHSTINLLNNAENVDLVALYGPEHGVRGDISAGETVSTYTDPETGIIVYSLYGNTRKPLPEMLKDIDVLVYDIQDIGVRSYTFISTMGLAMEAAAENGVEFMVLDRPNPLGGEKIEGNIVEDGYFSFVSQFPIPYVYGLTPGEVAKMINGEGWLKGGKKCKLTVIPMDNWTRNMTFEATGLPWVPTSPHIPHAYSPYFYVSTGIMGELGVFSEGVGYTTPFQVFGAEWINAAELSKEMNALNLSGVLFRPLVYKPYYGRDEGKSLGGVQIYFTDYEKVNLMLLQFYFMQVNNALYPQKKAFNIGPKDRLYFFDKVAGTDQIRLKFEKNYKVDDIIDYLNKDVDSFRFKSGKYYLYH